MNFCKEIFCPIQLPMNGDLSEPSDVGFFKFDTGVEAAGDGVGDGCAALFFEQFE